MGIKSYKPYTPSRRTATGSTFSEVTKAKPERSLTAAKKQKAGRDSFGHISIRHRGGGAKRRYRLIDYRREKTGVTASVVAKKLRALSKTHQIIAITHLPQIAAAADDHFRIVKGESDDRIVTTLERLDEEGRVAEIARLLGGLSVTDATLRAAKDLLSASQA